MPNPTAVPQRLILAAGLLAAGAAVVLFGGLADADRARPSLAATREYRSSSAAQLSDADIATIVLTAYKIEIQDGEVARTVAANPEVREFATRMVDAHVTAERRTASVARHLELEPSTTDISVRLGSSGDGAREALHTLMGVDFDRGYVENVISYQRAVLALLDERLIPQARNPDLKDLLEKVRPTVAAHLAYASSLQTQLATRP